uniref:Uncharacterized protein n=1 Tax=Ditylenchus dipsaci TaxID=166011 RepID=A0A915DYH0_9BILA
MGIIAESNPTPKDDLINRRIEQMFRREDTQLAEHLFDRLFQSDPAYMESHSLDLCLYYNTTRLAFALKEFPIIFSYSKLRLTLGDIEVDCIVDYLHSLGSNRQSQEVCLNLEYSHYDALADRWECFQFDQFVDVLQESFLEAKSPAPYKLICEFFDKFSRQKFQLINPVTNEILSMVRIEESGYQLDQCLDNKFLTIMEMQEDNIQQQLCECCYCKHVRNPEDTQEYHDEEIGWETLQKLDKPENLYPMKLCGFSGKSRDQIAQALLTLAKHDIKLTDLQNGFKTGPETNMLSAKEVFDSCKGVVPREEYNTMQLLRVGRNYIDYEVPLHESPFLLNLADLWMFDEKYPRRRSREMGTDGASPGCRIIRVFANEFDEHPDHIDNDPPGWNSAAETAKDVENYIYFKWQKEHRKLQEKSTSNEK